MKPKKNYIIITIIFVVTIILCFYLRKVYLTRTVTGPSVIEEVSTKINENEINNHVIENPTVILYLSPNNIGSQEIDKRIRNILEKTNTRVLYLNTSEVNEEKLVETLKTLTNKKITYHDNAIYVFENGKIKKIYYDLNNLKDKDLKKIFKVME